ncbi:MAG: hypothetical protein JNJ76_05375 [Candidatus Competibacter sp.]|nr:hypothetical protein [Candidatus Competibacter sp.]
MPPSPAGSTGDAGGAGWGSTVEAAGGTFSPVGGAGGTDGSAPPALAAGWVVTDDNGLAAGVPACVAGGGTGLDSRFLTGGM